MLAGYSAREFHIYTHACKLEGIYLAYKQQLFMSLPAFGTLLVVLMHSKHLLYIRMTTQLQQCIPDAQQQ